MRRVAILGAGISGLTAAWYLTRARTPSTPIEVTLFEASNRTGGIIETVRRDGFTIDLGPDSWLTEKPAARELVTALGLAEELLPSNDETRRTHILLGKQLVPLPDGLRMMVPMSRAALGAMETSPLFSPATRQAFFQEIQQAAHLQRSAPLEDESIAAFTERHFGREILDRIAAPLLSGVFGGNVNTISVRAVMAPFVAMERERGSLILALEEREAERHTAGRAPQSIFTTLRSGLGTLTDALVAQLPPGSLRLNTRIRSIHRADATTHSGWLLQTSSPQTLPPFDDLILATPAHITADLLHPIDPATAALLPTEASSAILVALAWPGVSFTLPQGFGFLVPPASAGDPESLQLLATTFVGQKFAHRVPPGSCLLRAFLGGAAARRLLAADTSDEQLTALTLRELQDVLGPLPPPAFAEVRRWPLSLPQYEVGHLERIALLERRLPSIPGLHLLGNAFRGVGLPDLIREARTLAESLQESVR